MATTEHDYYELLGVARDASESEIKKAFRALAREIFPSKGLPGADHVMIGRSRGIERDFGLLRSELAAALDRLRKK